MYLTQGLYHSAGHLSRCPVRRSKQHLSQPLLLAQILLVTCFVPLGPFSPLPAVLLHQVSFPCFTAVFPICHFRFSGSHGFPMRISMAGISIHPLLGFNAHVTITLNWAQRLAIFVLHGGKKRHKPLNEKLPCLGSSNLPHFCSLWFAICVNPHHLLLSWFPSSSLSHVCCLSTRGNYIFKV